MPGRNALIEELIGRPITRKGVLERSGLSPDLVGAIEGRARHRKAKERAREGGRGPGVVERAFSGIEGGRTGSIVGGVVGGLTGGPTGAAHGARMGRTAGAARQTMADTSKDPEHLRAHRLGDPSGYQVERRVQQRRALRGEETSGPMRSATNVYGHFPGNAPMITDSGTFDPLGAGVNALSMLLLAAGVPGGAPEASAAATEAAIAEGLTAAEVAAAGAEAAAAAPTAQGVYAGTVAAGAGLPEAVPERWKDDPVVQGALAAGLAATGGALSSPAGHAVNLGAVGDVLRAPGSLVPSLGSGTLGRMGNAAIGALPNVATYGRDVMRNTAAERRSRFRRLLSGVENNPMPAGPIDLFPDPVYA